MYTYCNYCKCAHPLFAKIKCNIAGLLRTGILPHQLAAQDPAWLFPAGRPGCCDQLPEPDWWLLGRKGVVNILWEFHEDWVPGPRDMNFFSIFFITGPRAVPMFFFLLTGPRAVPVSYAPLIFFVYCGHKRARLLCVVFILVFLFFFFFIKVVFSGR